MVYIHVVTGIGYYYLYSVVMFLGANWSVHRCSTKPSNNYAVLGLNLSSKSLLRLWCNCLSSSRKVHVCWTGYCSPAPRVWIITLGLCLIAVHMTKRRKTSRLHKMSSRNECVLLLAGRQADKHCVFAVPRYFDMACSLYYLPWVWHCIGDTRIGGKQCPLCSEIEYICAGLSLLPFEQIFLTCGRVGKFVAGL